ncbi:mrna cap guanine-n7 methyltransferase 2 [Quercus suber]|uniref:Mrna cap guanine-n7 methyltransferase 2 n=1 Tax=Quercus suber TaxID=58331 RepID=A0AAW0JI99_QUESU
MSSQVVGLPNRSESSHQKLYEFAKMALIKIFAHPYATVCDLYCCGGGGLGIDNDAQIGHYIGIDVSSTGIAQLREAWESLSQKKPYPSDFFHFDPCLYQKNVEAYHNKVSSMKPNIVPNCIRSESYMITFEVEEEKFPLFGKKYQLKFASDPSAETHCLVHFPSFIRLAREAGLEYVEIQNLTEFYDDNRFVNLCFLL